jgi:hypothetical protein
VRGGAEEENGCGESAHADRSLDQASTRLS